MSSKWSLDQLYSSFEAEEFKQDFTELENVIQKLVDWSAKQLTNHDQAVAKAEKFIELLINYEEKMGLLMSFARLKLSVDVDNQQAARVIEQLEQKEPQIKKPQVQFQQWLGEIKDLEAFIAKSELLQEHEFFLTELAEKSKYLLTEKEEVLMAELRTTGANAWHKLRQKLTSKLMVEITIDGQQQELPLSKVRNMAYEEDADVRQKAYQAELAAYEQIEDSVASCLNSIKGESLTIANKRGYESPLAKSLVDSRLDKEILEAMLTAIKESLSSFQQYYQHKAKLLGHEQGLPFYDLFAPLGAENKEFSYQEAREFIVDNFSSFSEQLGEYADRAFTNNWIDAQPRAGKRGGAFCMNLHPIGESRILANFEGKFSNVLTLAHELGHGYHGSCLQEESILNADYPMPLAETASIFCETIVQQAAMEAVTDEEKVSILENSLQGAGQVIVDIYSRYLFESKVFARRKEASLAVDELKELMVEAQQEAYGAGLDQDYLHPYMWLTKTHYYFPGFDFYNYPYAFGLLFGKGLYAQYLERGDQFVAEYDQLLAATGQRKAADVAEMMDIDLYSVKFWRDSLQIIEEDIKRFIELSG